MAFNDIKSQLEGLFVAFVMTKCNDFSQYTGDVFMGDCWGWKHRNHIVEWKHDSILEYRWYNQLHEDRRVHVRWDKRSHEYIRGRSIQGKPHQYHITIDDGSDLSDPVIEKSLEDVWEELHLRSQSRSPLKERPVNDDIANLFKAMMLQMERRY